MFRWVHDYWFGRSISIYMATSMTGLTGRTIWQRYRKRKKIYRKQGIRVNSPVPGEGIKDSNEVIANRPGRDGTIIWAKDKGQIKRSNVFVFPPLKRRSQGCEFELAKARGSHWKPTVFIHERPGFIAQEQSDIVCPTDEDAARLIVARFGSRHQRAVWRSRMLARSLPGWVVQQVKEFFI